MGIGPESYLVESNKLTQETIDALEDAGLLVRTAHVKVEGTKKTCMTRIDCYSVLKDYQRKLLKDLKLPVERENIPGISRLEAGIN